MSVDGALAQYIENSGANNHARHLRRIHNRMMMGWNVRTAGGLATSGTANGGVARHFGVATTGDLSVQQRGAGANMSVDVLLGGSQVGGTESAHQGEYFVYNDATFNVVISASDPTNPRIDIVGIQVRDAEYSGASNDARLVVITGTAAGVPVEPTLPANFLTLARVDVAAAAGSITNANITDRRRMVSALGGVTVCASSTSYPTVSLWEGMLVYDRSLNQVLYYDGAAWVAVGASLITAIGGASVATSQTTAAGGGYVDLATVGPTVTEVTRTTVFVILSSFLSNSASFGVSHMGYAVSSATTIAAADTNALRHQNEDNAAAGLQKQMSYVDFITTLNAGSNIFTSKYSAVTGTLTAANRRLGVIAF